MLKGYTDSGTTSQHQIRLWRNRIKTPNPAICIFFIEHNPCTAIIFYCNDKFFKKPTRYLRLNSVPGSLFNSITVISS